MQEHNKKKHQFQKAGDTPGTATYVGKEKSHHVTASIFSYNENECSISHDIAIKNITKHIHSDRISWINITGVHNTKDLETIGDLFSIHPLTIEDIANTTQRAKYEEYDNYVFTLVKMAYIEQKSNNIQIEQMSIITGDGYVITFQETPFDVLDPIRQRIQEGKGKVRTLASDYLLYALIDVITDHYFTVIENISEKIEHIEEKLLKRDTKHIQSTIYQLKRELIQFKKHLRPAREISSALLRSDHKIITQNTKIYLRDTYDHTIQIIETLESMHDVMSGMMELYLSINSNKMNEIMKVLTIFSAIFIPLTFLSGIYGMNFKYIPEFEWKYGYGFFRILVVIITIGMLLYFKKRKRF